MMRRSVTSGSDPTTPTQLLLSPTYSMAAQHGRSADRGKSAQFGVGGPGSHPVVSCALPRKYRPVRAVSRAARTWPRVVAEASWLRAVFSRSAASASKPSAASSWAASVVSSRPNRSTYPRTSCFASSTRSASPDHSLEIHHAMNASTAMTRTRNSSRPTPSAYDRRAGCRSGGSRVFVLGVGFATTQHLRHLYGWCAGKSGRRPGS